MGVKSKLGFEPSLQNFVCKIITILNKLLANI